MQGWCSRLQEEFDQKERTAKLNKIIAKWSPEQKSALRTLQQVAKGYFEASSQHEVDLSGTGRASFEIEEEASFNNDFVASLEKFEKGQLPRFTSAEFNKADGQLNSIYSKIQSGPNEPIEFTTITPGGIKIAQRAWLRYREAWVRFGQVKYPSVSADSWRTWLTQERIQRLKEVAEIET